MTEFESRPMVGLLPVHSHLIQAGDLQAIVGDGVRDGVGGDPILRLVVARIALSRFQHLRQQFRRLTAR